MRSLIARLLLVLLLVSVFAPAALAIYAPAPHACCVRKPLHQHGSRNSEISVTPGPNHHDCCRLLVVVHCAQLKSVSSAHVSSAPVSLLRKSHSARYAFEISSSHSGRAPPILPIA
jgi:hypothetical protein